MFSWDCEQSTVYSGAWQRRMRDIPSAAGTSKAGQVRALQEDKADFLWTRTFSAGTRLCWASQKSRRRCQSGQQRSRTWSPAGRIKVALSSALSMLDTAVP